MRARAPGKLVLSGAYAVLYGAPAIVTAVSRYAIADTGRAAEFVTPEVRAAIGDRCAPWFDASELRGSEGKLGLGSSAAILVASLAALELAAGSSGQDAGLAAAVFEPALVAHRAAQGGGSGVDVACAAHGGTLIVRRTEAQLATEAVRLPGGLVWEVWAGGAPTSTSSYVAQVAELAQREPALFEERLEALRRAAEAAAEAVRRGDAGGLVAQLDHQRRGLSALGQAAGIEIVTPALAGLGALAVAEGAVVIPSGAGGGDVAVFVGLAPPSSALTLRRERFGHTRLQLSFAARGVHAC